MIDKYNEENKDENCKLAKYNIASVMEYIKAINQQL